MDSIAERLTAARQNAGYLRAVDAIKAFGFTSATYYQHENGNRPPGKAALQRYAKAFGVSVDWLLTGKGRGLRRGQDRVPVLSYVGSGAEVYPADQPFDEIDPPPNCPPSAFGVKVRGDSNMPLFEPGEILVCLAEPDVTALMWRRAVVDLEDGRRLLKQIAPGSSPGLFTLLSLNGEPLRDVRIVRAARIIWRKPPA